MLKISNATGNKSIYALRVVTVISLIMIFLIGAPFWNQLLPGWHFRVLNIDLAGAGVAIIVSLFNVPLFVRGNRNTAFSTLGFFILLAAIPFTPLFLRLAIKGGINLDIVLCSQFAFFILFDIFENELRRHKHFLKIFPIYPMVRDYGNFRKTFNDIYCKVGFPLFLLDFGFWSCSNCIDFGSSIFGGYGLSDGLNRMVLAIFTYVTILAIYDKITRTREDLST